VGLGAKRTLTCFWSVFVSVIKTYIHALK
jgi:hypothetical protein